MDDGSHDLTASIVARTFGNDCRVTLVQWQHNGGKSSALNAGLEVADGEYIVVMDCGAHQNQSGFARSDEAGLVAGLRA